SPWFLWLLPGGAFAQRQGATGQEKEAQSTTEMTSKDGHKASFSIRSLPYRRPSATRGGAAGEAQERNGHAPVDSHESPSSHRNCAFWRFPALPPLNECGVTGSRAAGANRADGRGKPRRWGRRLSPYRLQRLGSNLQPAGDVWVRVGQGQVELAARRAVDAEADQLMAEPHGPAPVGPQQVAVIAQGPVYGEVDLQDGAVAQHLQRHPGIGACLPQPLCQPLAQ